MNDPEHPILGVDIGGTKIAVVLATAAGEILASDRFETDILAGPEEACDRIASRAAGLVDGRDIHDVVGVSAPGPLSSRTGCFINPPNMPGWHGFSIRDALGGRLGRRVRLMNDANACAVAEWRFGAGQGVETMIYLTMSTGMGAGLVIGGRLHEGLDDMAGEIGHLRVAPDGPVGFGVRGSIEGFCSGPGLAQLAVTHLTRARHEERPTALLNLPDGRDPRLVTPEDIGAAACDGDVVAQEIFGECGEKLGEFSAWMIDVLNPERIIVGTLGHLYGEFIFPAARAAIDRLAHPAAAQRCELAPAALGNMTGPLSAVCAALT